MMAGESVQPDDETPLNVPTDDGYARRLNELLSLARDDLQRSAGSVTQELDGILADAHAQLDSAISDVDFALVDLIQDGFEAQETAQSDISRQINSQLNALNNDVNGVVDDLFNAGAIPPVTMTQINADLNSTDPAVFDQYFPGAFDQQMGAGVQQQPAPGPVAPVIGVRPAQQPVPGQPPQPGQIAQQPVMVGGQVILPGQVIPQPGQAPPDPQQFVPPFLQGGIPTRQPPARPPSPQAPPTSQPISEPPETIPGEVPPDSEPPIIDLTEEPGEPPAPQPAPPQFIPQPFPQPAPLPPGMLPFPPGTPPEAMTCLTPPQDTCQTRALPWRWKQLYYTDLRCKPGCPVEVKVCLSVSVPPVDEGWMRMPANWRPYTDEEIYNFLDQNGCFSPIVDLTGEPGEQLGEPAPTVPAGGGPEQGGPDPDAPAPPPGMVAWDRVDVCGSSEKLCDKFRDIARGEIAWPGVKDNSIAASVANGIIGFVSALTDTVTQITTSSIQSNPSAASAHITMTALSNIASHWLGLPTDYYSLWTTYTFQRCNPKRIPEQAEIDRMYLSHEFTTAEWKCFTQAHGNMEGWRERYVNTLWRQLGTGELIDLFRRGKIKEQEFDASLKLQGFKDASETRQKLLDASAATLTYSDLERVVVRDGFDDDVAKRFNLDKDLDRKFDGKAKEYADKIGLPHDVIRYLWRAHWKYPSDTALYDFIHLFPPDRPEVIAWNEANAAFQAAGGGLAEAPQKPIVFTIEDARRILEINDLAPEMVDAMIARSYHPINTSDGVRAFQAGYFSQEYLYWVYRKNGYNDENAKLMSQFASLVRSRMLANSTGVWTMRKIVKSYKYGELRRDEAHNLMSDIMPDVAVQNRLLDGADMELRVETIRECVKGLKRRFLLGEFDQIAAMGLLLGVGMAPDKLQPTIDRWTCERANRRKEPRVAMLCQWYTNRIIDADQYYERLIRLGYSSTDAARIAGTCHNSAVVKAATKAAQASEKARKEFIAEQRRQARELKAYEKEAQEEYARLTEAIEKRRKELEELLQTEPLPVHSPFENKNGSP